MKFYRKVKGATMFDKVRNTVIRESLIIALLLLRIERSQLGRFGHVSKMSKKLLPKPTLYPN